MDKRELSIPLYKVAENANSATICLRSYTQNVLVKERRDDAEGSNVKIKRKRKQSAQNGTPNTDPNSNLLPSVKRLDVAQDYCPADAENSDVESQFTGFCSDNTRKVVNDSHPDSDFRFPDEQSNEMAWMRFQQKWLDEEEQQDLQDNMNSVLFLQTEDHASNNNIATETDNDDLDLEVDDGMEKLCSCGSGKVALSENFVSHVWNDEKAKRGWTAEESGVMTIGEIYLMVYLIELTSRKSID